MENKPLTLQEIQQGSYVVLKKLKQIFDEHGWRYYLAFGTLIGAVRHQGFIPWDDDIDLYIPRKDYEEFVKYCIEHKEEIKPFEILDYRTNKDYPYAIGRFSDTRYHCVYPGIKDYNLGLYVDLYPLDNLDITDSKYRQKQLRMVKDLWICIDRHVSPIKKIILTLVTPFVLLKNGVCSKSLLIKKINVRAQKFNDKETGYVAINAWANHLKPDPVEDFFSSEQELLFEDQKFRVPADYDRQLRRIFGDYMKLPPEDQRYASHEYVVTKR